ncbi:MAG: hypothetical protein ACREBC_24550, partial [Pyrinomonadaceae bacterium]
ALDYLHARGAFADHPGLPAVVRPAAECRYRPNRRSARQTRVAPAGTSAQGSLSTTRLAQEAHRRPQGAKGAVRLSNRTDNGSAKPVLSAVEGMATSKGVIQGYTGVAAVDEKTTPIIAEAQAHGTDQNKNCCSPSSRPPRHYALQRQ